MPTSKCRHRVTNDTRTQHNARILTVGAGLFPCMAAICWRLLYSSVGF